MEKYVKLVEDENSKLNESSLSRLWSHTEKNDCGTITAFRSTRDCNEGEPYTKKENLKRNKSLLAKLQSLRYSVTSVKGSYIEDYGTSEAKEVGENVFFVVDLDNKGNLEKDLKKLGAEFDQDSILFIPKGRTSSTLIGTNKCKNGYPGFGKTIKFPVRKIGSEGEFFTRVNGRPFTFTESILEEFTLPQGQSGRWGCSAISKLHWTEIEL
jgi:hypothetical protein